MIQLMNTSTDHSSINNDHGQILNQLQAMVQQLKLDHEDMIHEVNSKTNYVETLAQQVQSHLADLHDKENAFQLNMSDLLSKDEKERSKLEKERSNFQLQLQCESQKVCKTFKQKLSKDQDEIENAIRGVNKLYDECNQTIYAEIKT